jgi:hypothetical protein
VSVHADKKEKITTQKIYIQKTLIQDKCQCMQTKKKKNHSKNKHAENPCPG